MKIPPLSGQPSLDLLHLERLGPDRWRFLFHEMTVGVEAYCLSEMLYGFHLHGELFHCSPEFLPLSKEQRFWQIDDEGMWLLSHLFRNWQEMYRKACPVVVESAVEPCAADPPWQIAPVPRYIFAIDPASGAEVAYWNQGGKMHMEARWVCQECGESFRKQIDVELQVWLRENPYDLKRICAACHKRLTREGRIIREAK